MPQTPILSAELFPPRSDRARNRFWRCVGQLESVNPAFVSITCGAFASTPDSALETATAVSHQTTLPVSAHLTLSAFPGDAWIDAVRSAHTAGLRRLVILRGDGEAHALTGNAVVHAIEQAHTVADFDVAVACYPEVHPLAESAHSDLMALKAKCDAGATRAISQMVFSAEPFLRFRDRAAREGVRVPLHCGVLPITRFERVAPMASSCGASLSADYHRAFEGTEGNLAVQRLIGLDFARDLAETLISEGVEGIHFYALNDPSHAVSLMHDLTPPSVPLPAHVAA